MKNTFLTTAGIGLLMSLQACGGGSGSTGSTSTTDSASTATSASSVAGTVDGFGSVIIDGKTYGTGTATASADTNPAAPASMPITDVGLGTSVTATADSSGNLTSVVTSAAVAGTIASITSSNFVVAGQTVKPRDGSLSPTVYDGVSGYSALAAGQRVVVYGTAGSDGVVTASRIEVKDPSSAVFTRVSGTVAALDTTAHHFTLGGLTIDYSSASLLPSGLALANGTAVAVWSDAAPTTANLLVAKTVASKKFAPADGSVAQAGGLVTDFSPANHRFNLAGVTTDYSAATFSNGAAADLANGRAVRALGSFSAGVLKATSVAYLLPQGEGQIHLTGAVGSYVSASSFVVRGVVVDASAASWVNGAAANLADGVVVKIGASKTDATDASVLHADSVEFVTSSGSNHAFAGTVAGYDATSGKFSLIGVAMQLGSAVTWSNADASAASAADFSNGDTVTVRGSYQSGVFVVSAVVFRGGATLVVTSVPGKSYEVNLQAGSFKLNGSAVRVDSSTVVIGGTLSGLRNGADVTVSGTVVNGTINASSIVIDTPSNGTLSRVRGSIADYVSAASFSIDGQAIDASAARFINGTAASLANGVPAIADGSMNGSTLKAQTVQFR